MFTNMHFCFNNPTRLLCTPQQLTVAQPKSFRSALQLYPSCRSATRPHRVSYLTTKGSLVIWFEGVLQYYGVPTAVFSLYILVLGINTAADHLNQAGWTVDTRPGQVGNADSSIQLPLLSPGRKTKTVLLQASDWKFLLAADFPSELALLTGESSSQKLLFPPLPGLLDVLIESWLDGPNDDDPKDNVALLIHLAIQFNYLYEFVPALNEPSFADRMKYEHASSISMCLQGCYHQRFHSEDTNAGSVMHSYRVGMDYRNAQHLGTIKCSLILLQEFACQTPRTSSPRSECAALVGISGDECPQGACYLRNT
ncbi:hypothetical protein BDW62DRAFT_88292 [Aspergillus aurantiobrunneus]